MPKLILSIFCFLLLSHLSYSQGCNDAGFCTMGDIKSTPVTDSKKSDFSASSSFRLGEKETMWLTLQPQVSITLWNSTKLAIQVPFHFIYGNLGFLSSPGDIAPAIIQNIYAKDSLKLSITIAGKIPINSGNVHKNSAPLPMAYQPSQGTWDGISGISLIYKTWHFSIAYQHNFNSNSNMYIDSLKNYTSDIQYFDSRKIDRGDDALLRIEKTFRVNGKPKYFFGVLPIYRFQEATIESASGKRISVDGSSGLTLNVNAGIISTIGKTGNIKLTLGAPAITRHVRPDGLTGTFVLSFSTAWSF